MMTSITSPFLSADLYRELGWQGTLPVPYQAKSFPPKGFTGLQGSWPTDEQVALWKEIEPQNIVLRLPQGIKGFDVDAYGDKNGDQTIAALEDELGKLPPTWRSSSRDDGMSGIYLYRVPEDLGNVKDLGAGVEVCQFGWRYVVAWPSIHKSGEQYRWYGPDGQPSSAPAPSELPDLPETWVAWLRERQAAEKAMSNNAPKVDMPPLEGLPADTARSWAVKYVKMKLKKLQDLPDQGWSVQWDKTVYGVAKDLVRLGNSWWSPFTTDELETLYHEACEPLRDDAAWNNAMFDKWARAIHDVQDAVALPAEVERASAQRVDLDATNSADFSDTVARMVGSGLLSGIYRRGSEFVRFRSMGEEGYNASEIDDLTSAQAINPHSLTPILEEKYWVYRWEGSGESRKRVHTLCNKEAVARAIERAKEWGGVPEVAILTHTPLIREDGTVHVEPGYDPNTLALYLPARPRSTSKMRTWSSAKEAREYILAEEGDEGIFGQIAWNDEGGDIGSADNRASYLALLLTPLLELIVPSPWPLFAISAPDRGTGKSLLAQSARVLYGGVTRGMPKESEEFRKSITTLLLQTTGKIVTFDNVERLVGSDELSQLLTEPVWEDRKLGANEQATLPNDRVWVVTGNNIQIRADQRRRTCWITLNADMEKPWERTGFRIPELKPWLAEHWEEVIAALAFMVTEWIAAGSPMPADAPERFDEFGKWMRVINGILAFSGANGRVGRTERVSGLIEDGEWAHLFATIDEIYEDRAWTVRQLVMDAKMSAAIEAIVPLKDRNVSRILGKGLARREDQWISGRKVVREPGASKNSVKWVLQIAGGREPKNIEPAKSNAELGLPDPEDLLNI